MNARTIINEAIECGISLSLNGGNLALKAATKPLADLFAGLQKQQAGIVALLKQEAVPATRLGIPLIGSALILTGLDGHFNDLRRTGEFAKAADRFRQRRGTMEGCQ